MSAHGGGFAEFEVTVNANGETSVFPLEFKAGGGFPEYYTVQAFLDAGITRIDCQLQLTLKDPRRESPLVDSDFYNANAAQDMTVSNQNAFHIVEERHAKGARLSITNYAGSGNARFIVVCSG